MSKTIPQVEDSVRRVESGPIMHADDGSSAALKIDRPKRPLSAGRSDESRRNGEHPAKRQPSSDEASAAGLNSGPDGHAFDMKLVEETQQQIRLLVNEIVELAKRDLSESQFYEGFSARCITALSGIGGAVWLKQRNNLVLESQVNLAKTQLSADGPSAFQHDRLLRRIFESGEATIVPPSSINATDDSGNPTPYLLVIAPIVVDTQTYGLIEIFQRAGAGPVTQRGYLRFLSQMAEVAGEFHKNRRLRQLDERQNLWSRLDQFLNNIHQSLDVEQTAYSLANEGRRLIDCDRLSVMTATGSRLKLVAASGLDMVQRRADQVKLMEKLATVVCRAKQPLFYTGASDDLAPQIDNALQAYLDLSHCKALAVVPLTHNPQTEVAAEEDASKTPKSKAKHKVKKRFLGAIIIEQLADERINEDKFNRIELAAQHGAAALANAQQYNSIFLLPVWQALGKLTWFTKAANLPKTILALAVLLIGTLLLLVFPYEFAMPAKGLIQPVGRHEVYTQREGVINEIPLPDQQNVFVEQGQTLIKMINKDFESELEVLNGRLTQSYEVHKEASQRRSLAKDQTEELKIIAEINEAANTYNTLQQQLKILQEKRSQLLIAAPMTGQVINWNVRQSLRGRPVLAGERLMTIVDPEGPWEVELFLPERGASHVLEFEQKSDEPLQVEFVLASHPGQTLTGVITQIDRRAELHEPHGNSLKILVAFDHQELAEQLRRPGTRVTAKILCGQKPLGFVLFREVWESVQSQILFWL